MPVRPTPRNISNARDSMGRVQRETMSVPAGTGITAGTGTVARSVIQRRGDMVVTTIFVDLTGLNSSSAGDIIGVNGTSNPCHFGRVVAADMGTIIGGKVECVEAPAGGINDIDLFCATEGTGVEDGAVTSLTETSLVDSGAAWTSGRALGFVASPAAGQYLYLVGSGAGASATYTAGQFVITLFGTP